jgi:hypothetical protein
VSLLARIFRRYRRVADLSALASLEGVRVEIEGEVDALDPLEDPLSGRPCVALDYHAWPPSTTMGMDGATAYGSRAYQVNAHQAVDFLLRQGQTRVLVQVAAGEDIASLHRRQLQRFGVGLRAEADIVPVGARVRLAGRVTHTDHRGSPHRTAPWTTIVRADRLWLP